VTATGVTGVELPSLRDELAAQLTKLEAWIDSYVTYRPSGPRESFEEWATSRGRPYT